MNTAYNTTTERHPIDSNLLEILCPSPNGAANFFYKNVGSLFSQVSAAKRKTFFLYPQSALAALPSDLPKVYSNFDVNFNTLLRFRIGLEAPEAGDTYEKRVRGFVKGRNLIPVTRNSGWVVVECIKIFVAESEREKLVSVH